MINCACLGHCSRLNGLAYYTPEKLKEKKKKERKQEPKHKYADAECPVHQSYEIIITWLDWFLWLLEYILIYIFMVAFKSLKNMLITVV